MPILPPFLSRLHAKRFFFAVLLLSAWFLVGAGAQSSCASGSGTCADSFSSSGATVVLSTYSPSWMKMQGTADAYTTGNNSIAISGSNYAYYGFASSSADVSQITVTPSATKAGYARQACVRLTTAGGYCVGFGSVVNGNYMGCYIAKSGQYLGNAGCGTLSAAASHSLAITAKGTTVVSLGVYVDGVQTGTVTDAVGTYTTGRPGLGIIGDGTRA